MREKAFFKAVKAGNLAEVQDLLAKGQRAKLPFAFLSLNAAKADHTKLGTWSSSTPTLLKGGGSLVLIDACASRL